MFRVLILLLITASAVTAWAPVASCSSYRSAIKSLPAASQSDGGVDGSTMDKTSRRGMLGSVFATASLAFFPSVASAKDSRSSAPSPWPYAPSPLPTSARLSSVTLSYEAGDDPLASFGAELSGMKTLNIGTSVNATGLNQAIEQSAKKRQINPRTHG